VKISVSTLPIQLHMTLQARNLVPTLTQTVVDSREQLLHQTQATFENFSSRNLERQRRIEQGGSRVCGSFCAVSENWRFQMPQLSSGDPKSQRQQKAVKIIEATPYSSTWLNGLTNDFSASQNSLSSDRFNGFRGIERLCAESFKEEKPMAAAESSSCLAESLVWATEV